MKRQDYIVTCETCGYTLYASADEIDQVMVNMRNHDLHETFYIDFRPALTPEEKAIEACRTIAYVVEEGNDTSLSLRHLTTLIREDWPTLYDAVEQAISAVEGRWDDL